MNSWLITVFKVTEDVCWKRTLCSGLELLSELADSGDFLEMLSQPISIQFCSI